MDNGVYKEFTTILGYICNRLFSVVDDGFGTRRVASVRKLFGGYQDFTRKFPELRNHSCTSDGEIKGGSSRTLYHTSTVFHRSYGCRITSSVYIVYMSPYMLMKKKV